MNVNTYTTAPQAVPKTQAAFSNALASAQASADPRFNMKEYDRNGVSRGKGTQYMAGIKGAQSLADGVASAYQIPMQDAATNAGNALQYQTQNEGYGLDAAGLAQQNNYSNALAALQRQQSMLNFQGNALGGLLGNTGGGGMGGWLNNFLGY